MEPFVTTSVTSIMISLLLWVIYTLRSTKFEVDADRKSAVQNLTYSAYILLIVHVLYIVFNIYRHRDAFVKLIKGK